MMSLITDNFSDICNSDSLRTAFQAQSELFEWFISMARAPDEPEVVNVMLQKTVDISIELTGADHGSLILLDSDGSVVDSILSRGDISENFKSSLIESTFKNGLAGWVRRHQKIGLINDTNTDDRWLTFPNQPYIARSAVAFPIISGEVLLGILTLKHSEPNHFSREVVELMRITATQMAMVLENACLFSNLSNSLQSLGKANQKIEAYSRMLNGELEKCRQIQKSFLPDQLPEFPGWDIEKFFFPARHVSGDFYDAFMLPGGYVGLAIGDVCDKGVGSALFMALYRSLIRIFSGQAQLNRSLINPQSRTVGGVIDPASIRQQNQVEAIRTVALTNEYIAQGNEMCMFATLFFGVLDPAKGKLIYINGGHEIIYIIDQGGIKEKLLPTGPAVGLIPQAEFEYKEVLLNPGEILFSYTDGVIDARSPEEERFTRKRLTSLLSQPVASALDLMQRIRTNLFAHIGEAPQEDDITMLAIQRR